MREINPPRLDYQFMQNFETITMLGLLETIKVNRLQEDVNKAIHLPSNQLEFYTDNELSNLIEDRKEAGWEIIVNN